MSRIRLRASFLAAALIVGACQEEQARPAAMASLQLDALIRELPHVDAPQAARTDAASRELARRLHAGVQLTGEQWKRLLLSTGTLRIRTRWPVDEPLTVSMRWHPWLRGHDLVLVPQRTDVQLERATVGEPLPDCGTVALPEIARWAHQGLGRLPLGLQVVPLRIELRRWHDLAADLALERSVPIRLPETLQEPVVVATDKIQLDLEIVPTLDEALPAHTSPEVDDAVRATLSLAFEHGEAVLTARRGNPVESLLAGLARALEIEILRGSEPLAPSIRLRPTDAGILGPPATSCRVPISGLPESIQSDPAARGRWSVRVRGIDDGILRSWGCNRRWAGEVVLSLDELLARPDERER
jgi:hypothetical protein